MKAFIDLHTHTGASGHFTNHTIEEVAFDAMQKGFKALAITDHSPTTIGSAPESYFLSLKDKPRNLYGIDLLLGCEIDILDAQGTLGLSDLALKDLDITIASLHPQVITPMSKKLNTQAIINAISRGVINIVGHSDDSRFELDYEQLVLACKHYDVALEINNASLEPNSSRVNALPNDTLILELCQKYNHYVSIGSDGHGTGWLGRIHLAEKLIADLHFPDNLVLNYNKDLLKHNLAVHKKIRQALV